MTLPFRSRRPEMPATGASMSDQFDELVLASYARLCRFGQRITGSRAAAEDIVQDVFAALWQRHADFDYTDPLPYLFRAVRNRAISDRRQALRRGGWLAGLAREWADREVLSSDPSEASELAHAIDDALAALPQRRRLIFAMNRDQHLTYAEIAATLGISIKTVETQMGRALKSLRERLAPYLP
jgi:RNA polymerase sigma-70 factor (ECF subfamily)